LKDRFEKERTKKDQILSSLSSPSLLHTYPHLT